jgi:tRNA(fMet)-specific endonuclease VapC
LAAQLEICEEVWLPLPVLAELLAGFEGGKRQRENRTLLTQLLAKPNLNVLLPDRTTAEWYARLYVQLRRAGTPIPANDIWIAAITLQHDLRLLTRDEHFRRIPQLLLG